MFQRRMLNTNTYIKQILLAISYLSASETGRLTHVTHDGSSMSSNGVPASDR